MPELIDLTALELSISLEHSVSCVVGAPGSGKTAQLRKAVAELEKVSHPDQILVLTPSRSAAVTLRDQLALTSSKPSSAPRARSISSFAFEQLSITNPSLRLLSGPAQQQLLQGLVAKSKQTASWGLNPKALGLAAFTQELRDLLQVAMEFGLDQEKLAQLAKDHPGLKLGPVIDLLPEYLAALSEGELLDPARLLTEAAKSIPSQFDWVLVDDAQDLSAAGLSLIERLAANSKVLLFGDPDSSTQGFRSAEPGAFLKFGNLQYLVRELPQPTSVQRLMARFVAKLPPASAGRQRAAIAVEDEPLIAPVFSSTASESDYLAAKLRRLRLEDSIPFSEMAVVLRTQTQVSQLSRELAARNVPVRLSSSSEPVSQNQLTRAMLDTCLQALEGRNTELFQSVLLSSFIGLNPIELRRLERQLVHQTGLPIAQAWEQVLELGFEFESREARVLNKLVEMIRKVESAEVSGAHEMVSMVWELAPQNLKDLALGTSEVALAANRDIDAALRLFAAAVRFDERAEGTALDFVRQQLSLQLAEDTLAKLAQEDAVLVCTTGGLGTQAFEVVALPRLQDGIWPNLRPRNSLLGAASLRAYLSGSVEDPTKPLRAELAGEIRIFYKALGATRSKLLLSAMRNADEQPSQFFAIGGIELIEHSEPVDFDLRRLVGRLRASLVAGDHSAAGLLAGFALAGIPGADPVNWLGLLPPSSDEPLFASDEPVLLSASSLEAFEKCPLHWFVKTFAVGQSNFQASIGTLLHSAFELATRPEDLIEYVESNWHALEFDHAWQAQAQKRRAIEMAVLAGAYLSENPSPHSVEKAFELEHGRLRIRGKIDRVERTATGLVVSDLKTGKSNLDAKDNLQLAIYQLAMTQLNPGEVIEGARLVSVGTGKLKVSEQPPLDQQAHSKLLESFAAFERQGSEPVLVANLSEHCNEDGGCQLLLARQVCHD